MNITKFCENGELLPILFAAGMDPRMRNTSYGNSYLHRVKDIETAKFLFDSGLDISLRNLNNETPLRCLLKRFNSKGDSADRDSELLNYFIEKGADVNERGTHGFTPLMYASTDNDRKIRAVEILLKAGANINDTDNSGDTALYNAAEDGYTEIVKLLIKYGADPNIQNTEGGTALFVSVLSPGHIPSILIEAGADPHILCKYNQNALHDAAFGDMGSHVNLLIAKNVNANIRDMDGNTPLHLALDYSHNHVIESLVKVTDLTLKNKEGKTHLHIAVEEMVYFILNKKRSKNLAQFPGDADDFSDIREIMEKSTETPYQIRFGIRLKNIKLLLEYGADVNIEDNEGITPIDYVIQKCEGEDCQMLINLLKNY